MKNPFAGFAKFFEFDEFDKLSLSIALLELAGIWFIHFSKLPFSWIWSVCIGTFTFSIIEFIHMIIVAIKRGNLETLSVRIIRHFVERKRAKEKEIIIKQKERNIERFKQEAKEVKKNLKGEENREARNAISECLSQDIGKQELLADTKVGGKELLRQARKDTREEVRLKRLNTDSEAEKLEKQRAAEKEDKARKIIAEIRNKQRDFGR